MAANTHTSSSLCVKERPSNKDASRGATKELLFDKPSGFTINMNFDHSIDNYGDSWGSYILSSITTLNFISAIEQVFHVHDHDVIMVSSTQSDPLPGDIVLIVVVGPIAQLTGPCKTKNVEILEDKINQVIEDLCTLVSYMPPTKAECVACLLFFHLFLQVIIFDLPSSSYTCLW